MGASNFAQTIRGASLKEAFGAAVEQARYEHGHGGYTGTIAEKPSAVEVVVPGGVTPQQLIAWIEAYAFDGVAAVPQPFQALVTKYGELYDDKWGPAVAVKVADGKWVAVGMASE